jgi:hypothetical protein
VTNREDAERRSFGRVSQRSLTLKNPKKVVQELVPGDEPAGQTVCGTAAKEWRHFEQSTQPGFSAA